ncbi:MAG TPA: hypothetical protein VF733_02465 [Candidatus Saccharimonadales bacterium]
MNKLYRRLAGFLGSPLFFYIILGAFVLQVLWLIFSAIYPMAFDEDFHLGVIRVYADQWSPFLVDQPPGADQFGALARDPSYLFHYLFSWPYRLAMQFTHNEAFVVVFLRLLNGALFTWGLVLMRRVLLRAKASAALAHLVLALFILIPIVPQLAAHINYDNAIMVLLPLMCLCVFSLVDGFRRQELCASALMSFIAVCMFMSLIKYAALPFIIAAVIFLLVMLVWHFHGRFKKLLPSLRRGFETMESWVRLSLIAACLAGGVLFAERYVVNMIVYRTPVPDCGQVLTVEQCSAYGPWGRDYWYEKTRSADFVANPVEYLDLWMRGMWYRMFFAVNGPSSDYTNYQPLPVPSRTATVVFIIGLAALLATIHRVFRDRTYLLFFGLIIAVYTVILFIEQFGMYRQTGQPVAINGRYLLPVLPLLGVILGRAIGLVFDQLRLKYAKAIFSVLVMAAFLHGGGIQTFILRSDSSWYWPSPAINSLNNSARKVLVPITIEGQK